MISLKELNPRGFPVDAEQKKNMDILHQRINVIRAAWGKPMVVTSGLRSKQDHIRIYTEKARKAGIKNPTVPMGSRHLIGAAVDISDPNGELLKWCKDNEEKLVEAELWCEDGTKGWVHFQITPPKSGRRFFLP